MEPQKQNLTPLAIMISAILISASVFYLGYSISGGKTNFFGTPKTDVVAEAPTPTVAQNTAPTTPTIQKVKLDNDAVEGKSDAPVTIVEFSDFECPFCKRHFQSTYPELKKNYIDTGKVKFIFRDLPLSFHEPAASKDALVANCAREQGGDSAYFKVHDALFTQTAGNGTGMTDVAYEKIITDAGLSVEKFKTCFADTDGKQKAEIAADSTYGGTIGASGTPTSFIGKSTTTGEINAEMIVGAQPYSVFQTAIEKYLK